MSLTFISEGISSINYFKTSTPPVISTPAYTYKDFIKDVIKEFEAFNRRRQDLPRMTDHTEFLGTALGNIIVSSTPFKAGSLHNLL